MPVLEYTAPTIASNTKPYIVFVGTYPPCECGIATFNQDLLTYCKKVLGTHIDCKVAAINLTPLDTYKYPKEVKWKIDRDTKKEYSELATTINADPNITGVVIQHEYGIFGGNEGEVDGVLVDTNIGLNNSETIGTYTIIFIYSPIVPGTPLIIYKPKDNRPVYRQ